MFRSAIYIDLPSAETVRVPDRMEWLRSLFGERVYLKTGFEELTMGALSLVEGLIEGFARAGVDDVIAFLVDKQVVYCDMNEAAGDLPLILHAAESAGVLSQPFREMHLVLAHQDASLHTLIDCQIKSSTVSGQAEMRIDLSSRLSDLRVRSGETAEGYAARIQAFAERANSFESARRWLDALTKDITSSLEAVLVGARGSCRDAAVQLIRPSVQQIGRFGSLRFGDDVQTPHYRPVPTLQRAGAYADPFYYYYYDPYYDFMSYVLVNTLQWGSGGSSPTLCVVEPSGSPLFGGAGERAPAARDYWVGNNAVSYDSRGNILLRENIPTWSDDDRGISWLTSLSSSDSSASTHRSGSSSSGSSFWSSSSSSCGSSSSSSSCGSSSDSSSSSCGSSSDSSSSSCGSSCSSGSSCGSSCSSGSSCNSS